MVGLFTCYVLVVVVLPRCSVQVVDVRKLFVAVLFDGLALSLVCR